MLKTIYRYKKNFLIKIRSFVARTMFGQFESDSFVLGYIKIECPWNFFVGSGCRINEGVYVNARAKVTVGNDVHLSPYAIINTGGLEYWKTKETLKHLAKEVVIKDGAWIGSGAIINPGVTIGTHSVIGAGAVVVSDIPDYSVAVGVPAQVVKTFTLEK